MLLTTHGAGTFADGGLLLPLDEFVETYQPSWLDPTFGYAGGAPVVSRLTQRRGRTVMVPYRNRTQVWLYRSDLLEDPSEQVEFEDRYGRELGIPLTWDEHAELAEFFHRPDDDSPLYGSLEFGSQLNQTQSWAMRFVSSANPSAFLFNADGSANVDGEAGIRATEEHRRSFEWAQPDALEGADQAELYGNGAAFSGPINVSTTKLSRIQGLPFIESMRAAVVPGRVVDGALARRPVAGDFTFGVNAFADPVRQEAAYLFLQWIGGARVNTWLSLTPSFEEPLHSYGLADPRVAVAFGESTAVALSESMVRSAPLIDLPGGWSYLVALDQALTGVLTGEQSAEAAMAGLQTSWDAITEEQGVESQVEAIEGLRQGYSDVVDAPPDTYVETRARVGRTSFPL